MVQYKWIALSNTTLGTLMAAIDSTIVMIALPAIFRGININPLNSLQYMLWIIFGYSIVVATLLVTFGRISDMFGRVRLYNIGFAIFACGSILLFLTPSQGNLGAIELITFRIVQGVGAAFILSNSVAIITDAFPEDERGKALSINQVAQLSGMVLGIVLGGILATYNWRFVFLISVPVSTGGTIWSYLKLKEQVQPQQNQKLDILGNITFAAALTLLLVGITYGLTPYGSSSMGWSSPWVIASLASAASLFITFPFVESRAACPLFRLELFKNRKFSMGNLAGSLAAFARGGLLIMLIIMLQGIWLPLHGISFSEAPFWAGVYILPLALAIAFTAPISGFLSDKYGARGLSTAGMFITGVAFIALTFLSASFSYSIFAAELVLMGIGMGLFLSPNTASIMNSVPRAHRGAASGMRQTLQNSAMTIGQALFFAIMILSLNVSLPSALSSSITRVGAPAQLGHALASTPASSAIFSAFLGYNPMQAVLHLLPSSVAAAIPQPTFAYLTGPVFFPTAFSSPFMNALRDIFYLGAALCFIAATCSLLRGAKTESSNDKKEKNRLGSVN